MNVRMLTTIAMLTPTVTTQLDHSIVPVTVDILEMASAVQVNEDTLIITTLLQQYLLALV